MSASPTPLHPLASVVKHGKTLTTLLRRARLKAQSTTPATKNDENIHEKVAQVIAELLGGFNREQGSVSLFPEESISRILNKIEESLEEFIKVDPDNKGKYQTLASKINDCKPGRDQSSVPASSMLSGNIDPFCQPSTFNYPEDKLMVAYEALEEREKRCLFCFALYPPDLVIKKRELIHCWIGLDLIDEEGLGNEVLTKFVLEELIEPVFEKKRFLGRYRMHQSVRQKLIDVVQRLSQYASWSIMERKTHGTAAAPMLQRMGSLFPTVEVGEIEALLNVSQTSLNAKSFESVPKMRNLKVLHLGTWGGDPGNYIVAEGMDALKNLKVLGSLSLQGVTGIKTLPDSVYRLNILKVLDLRACHNLESVSAEGIISLKMLTHLDLSECYLLDHLPKAITQLTNLQVLKGFVINSLSQKEKKGNGIPENAWPCEFSDLSGLKQLVKLTVRTRRLSFPTAEDFGTLCELENLSSLRIAWVGSSNDCQTYGGIGSLFPKKLHKLELQAAPEGTASRLLALISTASDNCLEKLYIRAGGLSDLYPDKHQLLNVKVLRLRYLPQLRLHWVKFRKSFSGLRYLEILGCPNLVFFPCDRNGVWESTEW